MKKILILTTEWGGENSVFSPNANCISKILLQYREPYLAHVVCPKRKNEPEYERLGTFEIFRVNKAFFEYWMESKNKGIIGTGVFFYRLMLIFHFYEFPLYSNSKKRRFERTIEGLMQEHNYDIILASYCPIDSFYFLSLERNRQNTFIISYMLDSVSFRKQKKSFGKQILERKGYEWELKVFNNSDLILVPMAFSEQYFDLKYERYRNKMCIVDYPLLNRELFSKKIRNTSLSKRLTMLYYGALYSQFRNPDYCCRLLSKIDDLVISFYTTGDCDLIINSYNRKKKSFYVYPVVSQKKLISIIAKSDVLLSIGNKNSVMVPSKLFEYLSTGKKIIHFCTSKQDSCLSYLMKYPNSIIINEEESFDDNLLKIKKFLNEKVQDISFEDILELYYLNAPEYTLNVITERLKQ